MSRLGGPRQWSTPAGGVFCPPAPVGGTIRVPVLTVRLHDGECNNDGQGKGPEPVLLGFRLRASSGPPSQNQTEGASQSLAGDVVNLLWGLGGATFQARLDVVSGVCAAAVFCDWLDVLYTNIGKNSAGITLQCAAAPGMVADRGGRRTTAFTLPAAGSVDVAIEQGAQSVELCIPSQAATGVLVQVLDSLGVVVGEFVAAPIQAPGANARVIIPGGGATLRLSNNPAGVALSCSAVFFLPL